MDVENRLYEALMDLESLLVEGSSVDESLEKCATQHGFKREVLEARARRALGDLASLRDRSLKQAEALMREHKAETAIEAYLAEEPEGNFPTWFTDRVGRPPTKEESDAFARRFAQYYFRDLKFEI